MADTRTTARDRNNVASGGLLVILGIALAVLIGFLALTQGWINNDISSDANRLNSVEPAAGTSTDQETTNPAVQEETLPSDIE
jgi:hypothetical protein